MKNIWQEIDTLFLGRFSDTLKVKIGADLHAREVTTIVDSRRNFSLSRFACFIKSALLVALCYRNLKK